MATKTFPYSVVWNGKIVPPNTPIEVAEETTEKPEPRRARKKAGVKNDKNAD